jgi:hypothetical protein
LQPIFRAAAEGDSIKPDLHGCKADAVPIDLDDVCAQQDAEAGEARSYEALA